MRGAHRLRLTVASALAALALASAAASQPIAEPMVRAALLYNFAKFTTWPADALRPGMPLTVCIVGDGAIAGTLSRIAAGRQIDGREVRVVTSGRDAGLRNCQIVYIAGNDAQADAEVLEHLKYTPALTVVDGRNDDRTGAIARLFVEDGRIRFSVNVDAMQRARIRISSKVLALGLIAKDDGDVAR